MAKILVTGAAGFIASKLAYTLAKRGDEIIGIDNINDYYDVRLKYARLKECGIDNGKQEIVDNERLISNNFPNLQFIRMSIEDKTSLDNLFFEEKFDKVVNLAAQAGVRYSITHPYVYMQSNMIGFLNILEACRHFNVKYLVFASSSSIYGMNEHVPYSEDDRADSPVSLYAASKKSNELMAHCYSKLYGIQTIGLRYFTVYGPWGRPDMLPMLLANSLRENRAIKVFNNGDMIRDFTYIDDIVEGTIYAIDKTLDKETLPHHLAYNIYNIGCSHPIRLMDFINEMEIAYGKSVKKDFFPMQPGDVYQTNADTSKLEREVGYKPHWSMSEGIREFVRWYKSEKNPL